MSLATPSTILIAGDQHGPLSQMAKILQNGGFAVEKAPLEDGNIQVLLEKIQPAMLIMSTPQDAWKKMTCIQEIHNAFPAVALFLVAENGNRRGQMIPKLLPLFEQGVQDIMSWPLSLEELEARVRAVLRHFTTFVPIRRGIVKCTGGVKVDFVRRLVTKNGMAIHLTRTEWMLLSHMATHAGKILTNEQLLVHTWGPEYTDALMYLRTWISRLRKILEDDRFNHRLILTQHGIGYLIVPEGMEGELAALVKSRDIAVSTVSAATLHLPAGATIG